MAKYGRQVPDVAQNLIEADKMERNSLVNWPEPGPGSSGHNDPSGADDPVGASTNQVPTWKSETGVTMSHTGNTDYPNSHLRNDPMFNVPIDAIGTEKPFWWDAVDTDIQDAYLTDKQRAHSNAADQRSQIELQQQRYQQSQLQRQAGPMQQTAQRDMGAYAQGQPPPMQQIQPGGGGKNDPVAAGRGPGGDKNAQQTGNWHSAAPPKFSPGPGGGGGK